MKKITSAVAFLFVFFQQIILAQPNIAWETTFGGTNKDLGASILPINNGHFFSLCAASSQDGEVQNSHGGYDYWLIKLNPSGGVVWQKTYGGSADDKPTGILATTDGNFIIYGSTKSSDGDFNTNVGSDDIGLIKIDPSGNILWQKTYGGTGTESVKKVCAAIDGGFLIIGSSNSNNGDIPSNNQGLYDGLAIKINQVGNIEWSKSFGGDFFDYLNTGLAKSDGTFILAGSSGSYNGDAIGNNGGYDGWALRLSDTGTIIWKKMIGSNYFEYIQDIVETSDGGYMGTGSSSFVSPSGSNSSLWVFKLNSAGVFQWGKYYGGSSSEAASKIIRLTNGNYLTIGFTYSQDGDLVGNFGENAWLLCINSSGDKVWSKTYGGSEVDEFVNAAQLPGDNIIVVGTTQSSNGDVLSGVGPDNLEDMWVVRLGSFTDVNTPDNLHNLSILPNPATNYIDLLPESPIESGSISICSINGHSSTQIFMPYQQRVYIDQLPPGMYILKVESQGKSAIAPFIKI